MARSYVWYSESGGPGKTTNAVHTTAAIARDGHDTVLIDIDPQRGGATHHLGHDNLQTAGDGTTITDVLFEGADPGDVLVEGEHVDLIPSHSSLSNFETRIGDGAYRGMQEYLVIDDLVDTLVEDHGYEVVVIDAPATLSKLVDNAIVAAQNVMVPIELTPKGKVSQHGLDNTIQAMNEGFQREVTIAGLIPSRVANAKIFETIRDELESDGLPISPFSVPEHSLLKYSWRERMDLFEFVESEETRELRSYESHVPLAFKVVGRMMSGEYDYDEALAVWDDMKDQEMGDATPEVVLDDDAPGEEVAD
jgi:chromosome partitioning protein